jgi:NAD(P)-dependent dehydrogenase (short-subunit alcohol dehydrogenase family)
LALARLGFAVVVNSRPRLGPASADDVVSEIRALGGQATAYVGSVAEAAGARAAIEYSLAAFGRLDALVINAGTVLNKPFHQTTDDDLREMLDIHLGGPFAAVQQALPSMRTNGWGRIVLTGSGSAAFGLENQSAYASAKAAMVGLCNVLKRETLDADIMINVVLPVAPPLGRTPASKRIAEMFGDQVDRLDPAWVAPLVCLLSSEACPGTGGVYSAVGGRYARVFTAVGQGWRAPGREPPGLTEMAAQIDAIMDQSNYQIPASILQEIESVALDEKTKR